jgi:hypothetical protein
MNESRSRDSGNMDSMPEINAIKRDNRNKSSIHLYSTILILSKEFQKLRKELVEQILATFSHNGSNREPHLHCGKLALAVVTKNNDRTIAYSTATERSTQFLTTSMEQSWTFLAKFSTPAQAISSCW